MQVQKASTRQAQETLRRLHRPLIITDKLWQPTGLQRSTLKRRYNRIQEEYAVVVNQCRREWDTQDFSVLLGHEDTFESFLATYTAAEADEALASFKLWANYIWARERGNKYLLKEELDAFPCMNYTLKEGPYIPPLDAKFGAEDQHVVLKGREGDLFFFQTQLYGFDKGWYVETAL